MRTKLATSMSAIGETRSTDRKVALKADRCLLLIQLGHPSAQNSNLSTAHLKFGAKQTTFRHRPATRLTLDSNEL